MRTKQTKSQTETEEQELRQFEEFHIEGRTIRVYTDEKSPDYEKMSVFVTPYALAQIKFKQQIIQDLCLFYVHNATNYDATALQQARHLKVLKKEGNEYADLSKLTNVSIDEIKILWQRFKAWGWNVYDKSLYPCITEIVKGAVPTNELMSAQKFLKTYWDPASVESMAGDKLVKVYEEYSMLASLEHAYQLNSTEKRTTIQIS